MKLPPLKKVIFISIFLIIVVLSILNIIFSKQIFSNIAGLCSLLLLCVSIIRITSKLDAIIQKLDEREFKLKSSGLFIL